MTPAEHLQRLLDGAMAAYQPSSARVVRIRGWFGPRWLRFGGKMLGAMGVWCSDAVVPPFHPHRVLDEVDLIPSPAAASNPLHGHRRSETNLRVRLAAAPPNGTLAAWISDPEPPDTRASLMVYLVRPGEEPMRWYVEAAEPRGRLSVTPAGITGAELEWLLRRARADNAPAGLSVGADQ